MDEEAAEGACSAAASGQLRGRRGKLTAEGLVRLSEAAVRGEPWRHATGPRTAAGRRQSTANGKVRQLGPLSVREVRAALADVPGIVAGLREVRRLAGGGE
jgi:hypothetical protein